MAVVERHSDLVEELLAEVEAYKPDADRELLVRAFDYAAKAHEGQVRASGQEFIFHPWGVAKILPSCNSTSRHSLPRCSDVVEDTDADIDEVRAGSAEIAKLVEGVTADARKFRHAARRGGTTANDRGVAEDVRVILIKLADRLHNLRTIEYLGKQKQVQRRARRSISTRRLPIASVSTLKWEPRTLVPDAAPAQVRGDQTDGRRAAPTARARAEASLVLQHELDKVDIPPRSRPRKHFYSIYDKMVRKSREFGESRPDRDA